MPKRIGRLIEQRGYELPCLPAYSPDYNSIGEAAFAKIKHPPRKAAARSKEALVEAVGAALSAVTAEDAWASWNIPATVRRVSYCENALCHGEITGRGYLTISGQTPCLVASAKARDMGSRSPLFVGNIT